MLLFALLSQGTPPGNFGQLFSQIQVPLPRPAAIAVKQIVRVASRRRHLRPLPQSTQVRLQNPLQRINDLVPNDREELVGMSTAPSSKE